MGSAGLNRARAKMADAGVDEVAIETFAHYYRLLEHGETGMVPESSIEPVDMPHLDDVEVDDEVAAEAMRATAVVKLNGGLGTSMGMDRAKSLLCVRKGLSFLDIIARQVLHLREQYDATLPLLMMNSFRTSDDTMAALARYDDLPVDGLPLEFLQNKEPKLLVDDLQPVSWPRDPELEWCPPGHGDLYTALRGTGLLDRLIEAGYRYVFVSNSDNLGAVPDAQGGGLVRRVRGAVRDRGGTPYRLGPQGRPLRPPQAQDGRIVLRETAQTPEGDKAALADLERHRYCSTNNLWFDLAAMKHALDVRGGILGLPLIRNVKNVDPGDPKSPEVVQVETAMGAAIEVFEGALTICVDRDRFVPVKTTDDLLVLRSDVYDLGRDYVLDQSRGAGAVRRARRPSLQARRRVRPPVPRGGAVAARGAPPHRRRRLDLRPGVRVVGDVNAGGRQGAAGRARDGARRGALGWLTARSPSRSTSTGCWRPSSRCPTSRSR